MSKQNPAPFQISEVHRRVQQGFLGRLDAQCQLIRRLYAAHDWPSLRQECARISRTTEAYGHEQLRVLARDVCDAIPEKDLSRAAALPLACARIEALLSSIDSMMAEDSPLPLP